MKSTTTRQVFAVALVAIHSVIAGSRLWQPPVEPFIRGDATSTTSGQGDGGLLRRISDGNDSITAGVAGGQHHWHKRYAIINDGLAKPWPGGTVRYCFETSDLKNQILRNLKGAIESWYNSGLDSSKFKWKEVSASDCQKDRSNVLLISESTRMGHSASIGLAPATKFDPGPQMLLHVADLPGLDTVAAYAHEVGHVWGLRHEHQNPNFWRQDQGYANAVGGSVFGDDSFDCRQLSDYQAVVKKVTDAGQPSFIVDKLCKDIAYARQFGFSATEFLPVNAALVITQPGHSEADVDWSSIMLYPSIVGSGTSTNAVLKKPDGSLIAQNLVPSNLDVIAINKFYNTGPQTVEELLLKPSNSKSSRFRDLFRKDNGKDKC